MSDKSEFESEPAYWQTGLENNYGHTEISPALRTRVFILIKSIP